MASEQDVKRCCDMSRKVALNIAKIYSEEECGIPESTMLDFHDFGYNSKSGLPVAAALAFNYCPWCGQEKDRQDESRRRTEVVHPRPVPPPT